MKPPIVQTQAGKVQGKWIQKGNLASFKGIPYATPPVGTLRWKAPQLLQKWEGVKKTTKFSESAWQQEITLPLFLDGIVNGQGWSSFHRFWVNALLKIAPRPKQSEDCLYLNIKTPNLDSNAKLPVMVWIHGGDHQDGSSSDIYYDGVAIPEKGIVYVSINYRLGLMGYFAHPELNDESEHNVSGNYGTLDQIAALQWVKDNISAFGGDADNVTIFGESAGGESVAHMMSSPLAKGLFHKAILQSPANAGQMTHLSKPFLTLSSAEERGLNFIKKLGITGNHQVEQLRKRSAKELMEFIRAHEDVNAYYPAIDGYVLPKSPFETFHDKEQAPVPILLGSNADEGSCLHSIFELPIIDYQNLELSSKELLEHFKNDFAEEADGLFKIYPGLKKRDVQAEKDILGDEMFGVKARLYAEYAAKNNQPTYFYHFTRVPPKPKQNAGAYHAAEIAFVHGTDTPIVPLDKNDKKLSRVMIDYWTNFAKTGNPNGNGHPEWKTFNPEKPKWMVLDIDKVGMNAVDREPKYQLLLTRVLRQIKALKAMRNA